jgi:hypothetical protein
MEPPLEDICATVGEISHVPGGVAAKVLWTMRARPVIFHYACLTESSGVELGPLPLLGNAYFAKARPQI